MFSKKTTISANNSLIVGGSVNPQITTPSPYEELNKAATDAVAQWRFKPATRDGVIVPMQMIAPVKFQSRR
jgi:TonB family protein